MEKANILMQIRTEPESELRVRDFKVDVPYLFSLYIHASTLCTQSFSHRHAVNYFSLQWHILISQSDASASMLIEIKSQLMIKLWFSYTTWIRCDDPQVLNHSMIDIKA